MKSRSNPQWLQELRSQGPEQSDAIADLRVFLLRAAYYSLYHSRRELENVDRTAVEQLAEDAAQDALLSILGHLDEFRSESKFTTWAYKFAINFALVAARREHWKNVSLDELVSEGQPAAPEQHDAGPDRAALQAEAWATIRHVMAQHLTERQCQTLDLVVFEDVPLDEVARRWNSNRNATYKVLHDARRKLKAELEARGYTLQDLLDLFDRTG